MDKKIEVDRDALKAELKSELMRELRQELKSRSVLTDDERKSERKAEFQARHAGGTPLTPSDVELIDGSVLKGDGSFQPATPVTVPVVAPSGGTRGGFGGERSTGVPGPGQTTFTEPDPDLVAKPTLAPVDRREPDVLVAKDPHPSAPVEHIPAPLTKHDAVPDFKAPKVTQPTANQKHKAISAKKVK